MDLFGVTAHLRSLVNRWPRPPTPEVDVASASGARSGFQGGLRVQAAAAIAADAAGLDLTLDQLSNGGP